MYTVIETAAESLADKLPELEAAASYKLATAIRDGSTAGEQMVRGWTGTAGEMCALSAAAAALKARRML